MKLNLDNLEDTARKLYFSDIFQLPSNVLSSIADSMKNNEALELYLNGNALSAIGSGLSRGSLCIFGNLGMWTCNEMSGGYVYVKGNIERISNVHGGIIYIDGNIDGLINIEHPAKILCRGTIKSHLFSRRKIEPSRNIYCLHAPSNENSTDVNNLRKLSRKYQYLLKVNEVNNIPRINYRNNMREEFESILKALIN